MCRHVYYDQMTPSNDTVMQVCGMTKVAQLTDRPPGVVKNVSPGASRALTVTEHTVTKAVVRTTKS